MPSAQNQNSVQQNEGAHNFEKGVFERNRAKWLESNIKNYSFNINASGFLRPFLPCVIEVQDSKFVSAKPLEPSENKHWVDTYKSLKLTTIDEIFLFIELESTRKPAVLEAAYDDKYGFPISVIVDRDKSMADDELSFSLTNFKVKD